MDTRRLYKFNFKYLRGKVLAGREFLKEFSKDSGRWDHSRRQPAQIKDGFLIRDGLWASRRRNYGAAQESSAGGLACIQVSSDTSERTKIGPDHTGIMI